VNHQNEVIKPIQIQLRTLAALADAHDESFLLTRICDEEGFKPSQLVTAVKRLLGFTKIIRV
jgi:hypothetical protein